MSTKVAINGLGRIGRAILQLLVDEPGLELVAVNDLVDAENLAYLLRFDTVYGRYSKPVAVIDGQLHVGGRKLQTLRERDPAKLPWQELDVDVVFLEEPLDLGDLPGGETGPIAVAHLERLLAERRGGDGDEGNDKHECAANHLVCSLLNARLVAILTVCISIGGPHRSEELCDRQDRHVDPRTQRRDLTPGQPLPAQRALRCVQRHVDFPRPASRGAGWQESGATAVPAVLDVPGSRNCGGGSPPAHDLSGPLPQA